MDPKYNYRDLNAYKEAKTLVRMVYGYLKKYPREENYALCDQMRRSSISIPSNIAEGMGRFSTKEQVHFLEIAFASLMEVSSQLDMSCDLGYISKDELSAADDQVAKVAALLSGLRNKRMNSTESPINQSPINQSPINQSPITDK